MTWPSGYDITRGLAQGCSVNHKFGRNLSVGGTFAPVAIGGIYRTPQVSGATALRIKSGGNANDTATGTGARAVTLQGLDANGDEITETIATAGASASEPTTKQFLRLYRAYVSASGTYATATAASHAAAIVIENATGGTNWATIADTTIARGQSQVAVYSVPRYREIMITGLSISSDAEKKANLVLFQRRNILQTSAPYEAMRLVEEYPQVAGLHQIQFDPPLGPFPELTDIGFMARSTSTTIDMSVSFEIVEFRPQ